MSRATVLPEGFLFLAANLDQTKLLDELAETNGGKVTKKLVQKAHKVVNRTFVARPLAEKAVQDHFHGRNRRGMVTSSQPGL